MTIDISSIPKAPDLSRYKGVNTTNNISTKKSTAQPAAISKVANAALTAIKAVGIVFAIVLTAGIILANKNFRHMSAEFFFGPKIVAENEPKTSSEYLKNRSNQLKKEGKVELAKAMASLKKTTTTSIHTENNKYDNSPYVQQEHTTISQLDLDVAKNERDNARKIANHSGSAVKLTPEMLNDSEVFKRCNKPEVTEEPVVTVEPSSYEKITKQVSDVVSKGSTHVSNNAGTFAIGLGFAAISMYALRVLTGKK